MPKSPQDIYARHLSSHRGYPLWMPEPSQFLGYGPGGLRIGDVGVVIPEDGCFDVFFNICLPEDHPFHRPTGVPYNFTPVKLDDKDIRIVVDAENPGCILANSSVKSVKAVDRPADSSSMVRPSGSDYEFTLSSSEGALLILPEGAERHDLRDHRRFLEIATKHGAEWYRFAEERLGQIIGHDSLYLITGFHKTTSWALAAFEKIAGTAEYPAKFQLSQAGRGNVAATYTLDTARALDWRVGPTDSYGIANQSVFIRGFKISHGTGMFGRRRISVKADAPSTRPNPARSVGAVRRRSWLARVFGTPSIVRTTEPSGSGVQYDIASLDKNSVEREAMSEDSSVSEHINQCNKHSHRQKIDIILEWLDGLDCTAKHHNLASSHISTTCSWLYSTDEYRTWWSGDDSFFWLQGKAGSGKSIMAYSVIERLKHLRDPVMFFYCDYRVDTFASPVQVMYSLLCQMLYHLRDDTFGTPSDNGNLIDELLQRKTNGLPIDDQQLPSLVLRAAQGFLRRPFIVIDALDECEDVERLTDALKAWNHEGMQIFVTSRPLQIIKEKLFDVSPKSVISWDKFEKGVASDIHKFIEQELDAYNWLGVTDASLKGWLMSVLLEKTEGMFLLAKYQIDMLPRCSNISEIRQVLDKLPAPADFYNRVIHGIEKQKTRLKFVRRVLAWLVTALRPIQLCEVVEALMIDLDCRTMEPEELREVITMPASAAVPSHRTLESEVGSALLYVLGSLVTHNEATDRITFLHSSFRTYLTDPATNSQYQIDLEDAHEELAATCMCYLSLCLEGCLTSINDEPPFRITLNSDAQQPHHTGSPLLEYVLNESFHHLSLLQPGNEAILGDMLALESDLQQHPNEWGYLCRMASHARPWPSMRHSFIIYTLVAFAPDWLLRAFLDRESLFLRLERHRGTNPLIYTAHFHAIDQARTLLFRGANLHSRGWLIDDSRQTLPLTAAVGAEGQSIEMLELFLEWRSPIPTDLFRDLVSHPSSFTLPIIRRLLQTDEFVGWLECHQEPHLSLRSFIPVEPSLDEEEDLVAIAWRLVQVGLDPDVFESDGKTAIHLASAKGYSSLVEYLVSIGVHLPNDILFFVLEHGRLNARTAQMIRYLLEEGADIHFRPPTDTGNTLLHTVIKYAATRLQSPSDSNTESSGLVEIVTTLVSSGCDTRSRDVQNYTPLHLAIVGGHVPVVKYLSQVTTPLPEDLSAAVLLAPSSVRGEIKEILSNGD